MSPTVENGRGPGDAGRRGERLRSSQIRMLIAAALAVSLVFGGAFVVVGRLHSTPSDVLEHPGNPLDDDQSKTQVIEPARQIAALTQLRTSSAGYALMSCKSHLLASRGHAGRRVLLGSRCDAGGPWLDRGITTQQSPTRPDSLQGWHRGDPLSPRRRPRSGRTACLRSVSRYGRPSCGWDDVDRYHRAVYRERLRVIRRRPAKPPGCPAGPASWR
jgi:hypothetical protein